MALHSEVVRPQETSSSLLCLISWLLATNQCSNADIDHAVSEWQLASRILRVVCPEYSLQLLNDRFDAHYPCVAAGAGIKYLWYSLCHIVVAPFSLVDGICNEPLWQAFPLRYAALTNLLLLPQVGSRVSPGVPVPNVADDSWADSELLGYRAALSSQQTPLNVSRATLATLSL